MYIEDVVGEVETLGSANGGGSFFEDGGYIYNSRQCAGIDLFDSGRERGDELDLFAVFWSILAVLLLLLCYLLDCYLFVSYKFIDR